MDPSDLSKIASLESELLKEKPWQLRGEVSARARPKNSLLFEDVKFEQKANPPKITPEYTQTIESMIKQRIKDNQFDDPIRKQKPTTPIRPTNSIEVSSEKSKVGLATLYEQEIVAKASSDQVKDGPEKDVEKKLMALFRKLDALCER